MGMSIEIAAKCIEVFNRGAFFLTKILEKKKTDKHYASKNPANIVSSYEKDTQNY